MPTCAARRPARWDKSAPRRCRSWRRPSPGNCRGPPRRRRGAGVDRPAGRGTPDRRPSEQEPLGLSRRRPGWAASARRPRPPKRRWSRPLTPPSRRSARPPPRRRVPSASTDAGVMAHASVPPRMVGGKGGLASWHKLVWRWEKRSPPRCCPPFSAWRGADRPGKGDRHRRRKPFRQGWPIEATEPVPFPATSDSAW